ncbi:MAG TPA: hypothetical protein PKC32_14065, partial [Sphingopyxis sp.]|nr:hypothetical protein [Sphingopyxis sp.]
MRKKLTVFCNEEKHRCAKATIMLILSPALALAGQSRQGTRRIDFDAENVRRPHMTHQWQPQSWRSHEARQLPT